ncbi:MAG: TatD family hydrolase [Candidatus Omnitrophota bacterium]|nr:MAG: TatD family hydrolase [Candidatus Omnitrophota bacterium]
MLIDSHCHINTLSSEERGNFFKKPLNGYLFVDSSIDLESTLVSLNISRKHGCIYSSVGFHPFSADKFFDNTVAKYKKLITESPKVIAVGEIGLDYKADASLARQEEILREFIQLAQKKELPISIHNRLQGPLILNILDDYYSSYERVVFHCFSYSMDFLEKIVEKNGLISFSLNVLRKRPDLLASLKACPLDNLILETDSPYMRIGARLSSPLDIEKVYSFVSEVKRIDEENLKIKIQSNAESFFSLKR